MGCDIHCYMEYTPRERREGETERYWYGFGGRINPGRNYEFFATVANVRNWDGPDAITPMYELRGVPEDMGFSARYDNTLYVSETDEEHNCTREQAESWVEHGCSKWAHDDKSFVTHPDWHSHTWLTGKEWREAVAKVFCSDDVRWHVEYHAMCAALSELEKRGYDTRVVMWFDN